MSFDYDKVIEVLTNDALVTFKAKEVAYGSEYEGYTLEDIHKLLTVKVEKIGTSMNISEAMFKQDCVDCLNWLAFLYGKKLTEKKE